MSTRLDAITSGYGVSVARSQMKIEASDANPSTSVFEMVGFISDSSYSTKEDNHGSLHQWYVLRIYKQSFYVFEQAVDCSLASSISRFAVAWVFF